MQKGQENITLTAGICNIPLTLPANLYFIVNDNNRISEIKKMLDSFKIEYKHYISPTKKIHIMSVNEVESRIIKQVFRNFRTLKPRLLSNYRYLFWEIDSQDEQVLNDVMSIYRYFKLPVYVHKSYRGYHFLSVKPIEKTVWDFAIQKLRGTNPRFPPVTLRILANKHDNELSYYKEGFCYYPDNKTHKDTEYLRKYIENQDVLALEHYYMIVFYRLPQQNTLDDMTLEQRERFEHEQIANSEENRIV